MEQALAVGALVPAALGAGCCAAGGRRTGRAALTGLTAMLVMLLAMLDAMVLGERLLPTFGWAAVLAGLAAAMLLPGGLGRRDRALHLGVMALLTAAMTHPMDSVGAMHDHSAAPGVAPLAAVALAAGVGYSAYAGRQAATGCGWARLESLAGGLSALAMTVMVLPG